MIASNGPFHIARKAMAFLAIGIGCCLPTPAHAVANPFLYNVRPTEMFLLATSADDPALRARVVSLSPTVRPDEANRVVECAYNTGRELAHEWDVVPLPGVQNYLVNTGARKGGLCFQWAGELLIRLNALKLQTLDLHWAESYPGTGAEHNVIVVTGKGQPFQKGIILDNWRYQGHLVYCWVPMDPQYRWKENRAELTNRLNAISPPSPQVVSTKSLSKTTTRKKHARATSQHKKHSTVNSQPSVAPSPRERASTSSLATKQAKNL